MFSQRIGKALAKVEMTKAAQAQGKRVFWATFDQVQTAETLAKHGALCELVGSHYVAPHFRKQKSK